METQQIGKTDRQPCPLCTLKHLSQARALLLEQRKGYPYHIWYATGHLAEAEDEIQAEDMELCTRIRELRLRIQGLNTEQLAEQLDEVIAALDPLMAAAGECAMIV